MRVSSCHCFNFRSSSWADFINAGEIFFAGEFDEFAVHIIRMRFALRTDNHEPVAGRVAQRLIGDFDDLVGKLLGIASVRLRARMNGDGERLALHLERGQLNVLAKLAARGFRSDGQASAAEQEK